MAMELGSPLKSHRTHMMNIMDNVVKDSRVLYWDDHEHIPQWLSDYTPNGSMYVEGENLTALLDTFNVIYEGDRDDNYFPRWGTFLTAEEAADMFFGYSVNYGNPIGRIFKVDPGDSINAAFLRIYYKHRTSQKDNFYGFYVLYSMLRASISVCVGFL